MRKPFNPATLPLPPSAINYDLLIRPAFIAHDQFAKYKALMSIMPASPLLLLSSLGIKEAVISSRIEGTRTELDEALDNLDGESKMPELDLKDTMLGMFHNQGYQEQEKFKDLQEVLNYNQALEYGGKHLTKSKINLKLIKQCHKILMQSVRGKLKNPGVLRKEQNWIGRPGQGMEEAIFIPPPPHKINDLLKNWIDYAAQDDYSGPLIQSAILHGQFEIIHPFRDGNGRIGRLLIPMFLYSKRYINIPAFYLSESLEKRKSEYYERLLNISQKNQWNEWIIFFLETIQKQAEENIKKISAILELYQNYKNNLSAITHSQYGMQAIDYIFSRPRFNAPGLSKKLGVNYITANNLVRQLDKHGIVRIVIPKQGNRAARWEFTALLKIIRD